MKNKDIIVLKKILEYCNQLEEACDMFGNDYNKFVNMSAFSECLLYVYIANRRTL